MLMNVKGTCLSCYSAAYSCKSDSWLEAFYSQRSGSRLAWVNDIAGHYAAIRCPHQRTAGPAEQPAVMPLLSQPQSATPALYSVACFPSR